MIYPSQDPLGEFSLTGGHSVQDALIGRRSVLRESFESTLDRDRIANGQNVFNLEFSKIEPR